MITGTGKYPSFEAMRDAVVASAVRLVTVAVRRIDLDGVGEAITDWLPDGVMLLPNTAAARQRRRPCAWHGWRGPAGSPTG